MVRIVRHNDAKRAEKSAITIFPQAVFDDVDALTHRRAHGDLSDKEAVVRDTAGSDSRDPFDRGVLTRHVEFRDAQVHTKLRAYLFDPAPNVGRWDDWKTMTEEGASLPLRYGLTKEYGSNVVRTASAYLHRFFVRALLRDWYLDAGIDTLITEEELEGLLDDILGLLRPGYVRTPLHPFDPKY